VLTCWAGQYSLRTRFQGGVIRCVADTVPGSFITFPTHLNLGRGSAKSLPQIDARRLKWREGRDERMPRIESSLGVVTKTKICAPPSGRFRPTRRKLTDSSRRAPWTAFKSVALGKDTMMTGKNIHVALTFDYDAYSVWIETLAAKSPSMISRGEFGPQGVRRILQLLGQYRDQGNILRSRPYCACVSADSHRHRRSATRDWPPRLDPREPGQHYTGSGALDH
jgi:hypothetical protein